MLQQTIDSRNSVNHSVSGNQINLHYHTLGSSNTTPCPLSFNDAPIDLLSIHFTGREHELGIVKEALNIKYGSAPTRCAIHGMPGLGKTQLALRFAKLTYDQGEHNQVFWISATTVEKLNQGFAKILDLVNHPDRSIPDQNTKLTTARRWLEESDSLRWLLILDNVDRKTLRYLQEHLPRKNHLGNIVFTTRTEDVAKAVVSAAGQRHHTFELQALDLRSAANLFLQEAGWEICDVPPSVLCKAENLVRYIACLPLAVNQAASFMQQAHKTLDDLLLLFHQSEQKMQLINWENDLSSYEAQSVAVTFSSQLRELEQQSPDASNLLKVLSFLDPECIPVDIIVDGAKKLLRLWRPSEGIVAVDEGQSDKSDNKSFASTTLKSLATSICSPVQLHGAIRQLQNLSLVGYQSNIDTDALRIHDLIQFIVQDTAKKENDKQHWFEFAVLLTCHSFRRVENVRSPQCWSQCEIFLPHMQSLTIWDDLFDRHMHELTAANMLIATYLSSRGRYGEAESLYTRVLATRERLLGNEHVETFQTMHELAVVHRRCARYREAQELYERTLAGREKQLGAEHEDTLWTVHNLAIVFELQGQYEAAEPLYRRALCGIENQMGPEHMHTLEKVGGLATLYEKLGRYDEAEKLYVRALSGNEKRLGAEHPNTLWTMHNLAQVYQQQGRYDEAQTLYLRVLAGREMHLGAEHPHTLRTVHGLATVYRLQGRYFDSEKLYLRALAGQEKQIGVEHPDTLRTVDDLGVCLRIQGRLDEAEKLHLRAVTGNTKELGAEHPSTYRTQHNLAVLRQAQGLHSQAEALYSQALVGRENQLGHKHPNTLWTMKDFANFLDERGQHEDAKHLRSRFAPPVTESHASVPHSN